MPLKFMYITNDENIAKYAQKSGVDRIFIDLEILGKVERQGHLDTVISRHSFDDVKKIKHVLDKSDLLVRVNPINENTEKEVDRVIEDGADIVMLPMFKTVREVERFVKAVNGRARVCLLLETSEAMVRINDIVKVSGIDEIHVGLNDLHLALNLDFMFELLSGGIVEYLSKIIKGAGIDFGFGGIAKVGEGHLPAEKILAEHVRLDSKMVILSRAFHLKATCLEDLTGNMDLANELQKIKAVEEETKKFTKEQFEQNMKEMKYMIDTLVCNIQNRSNL